MHKLGTLAESWHATRTGGPIGNLLAQQGLTERPRTDRLGMKPEESTPEEPATWKAQLDAGFASQPASIKLNRVATPGNK